METLLDLLDRSVARFGEQQALGVRTDDGTTTAWTYRELDRRSRIAAWRLRAAGLEPGDRVLTWSASTPELPAAYFGAIRARLVIVPLDLRMSAAAIRAIADRSGAKSLVLGTGRDAPDPREAGLADFPTILLDALCAEPDETFPPDWTEQVAAWPRPAPDEVFDLIFTSGTTGTPKGVMLAHDNVMATIRTFDRIIPPLEHRIVSLLPLSHLLEKGVGLFYALSVGSDILYVRSRNPRVVFDAIRGHRVTSMIVVPQVLDLFWSALEREVDKARRTRHVRSAALRSPGGSRWRSGGSSSGRSTRNSAASSAVDGELRCLSAPCAPAGLGGHRHHRHAGLWLHRDRARAPARRPRTMGSGRWGVRPNPSRCALPTTARSCSADRPMFKGYWMDPVATAAAFDADGWYHTGDLGRLDDAGRLILHGRKKDMIVLSNGFNVFPEDIENALRDAGLRDSVVLETGSGRIEAIVLLQPADEEPAATRARLDASSGQGRQRSLGPKQQIAGWRLWPDDDFPRTHTLKIRDPVRRWVAADAPVPVRDPATRARRRPRAPVRTGSHRDPDGLERRLDLRLERVIGAVTHE